MSSSDQVDDGEQDDPHQVHEVPVQPDHLDPAVVVPRVFAPQRLGDVQVRHRDDAARDVEAVRSEEHTSELQSLAYLVCRLLLEKKKNCPPTRPSTCLITRTSHRSEPDYSAR